MTSNLVPLSTYARSLVRLGVLGVAFSLASCVTPKYKPIAEPMKISKNENMDNGALSTANKQAGRDHLTSTAGPTPPTGRMMAEPIQSSQPPKLTGEPISINFEGVRLPAFINTVFGELLKVTFEIDNAVAKKDVLVTLRTAEPMTPDKFYQLVNEVLANYGISVVYSNNVYRVIETANAKQTVPRIIRSRTASSIPNDMRPVFYFLPVNNISASTIITWLDLTLKDRVRPVIIPNANGLLLLGNSEDVAAAVETVQTLDQPYMAGYQSIKISPAFWSAQKLAQQLTDVMTAEGFSISIGASASTAVKLVPVEALNTIIAFGTSNDVLRHLLQWATDLDQPSQTIGAQNVYYYQVNNAKAKDLSDTVKSILEGTAASPVAAQDQRAPAGGPGAPGGGGGTGLSATSKSRITVDEARNGIIFQGSAEEYAQFRSLMVQMDRAPLAVLIEATVAEVTLTKDQSIGTTFGFNDSTPGANSSAVTVDATGLNATLIRDMGNFSMKLNALASDQKVQVLSNPRLVTNSGKTASINVGTQVPIITEQQQAPGTAIVGGTSTVLQSVQYRSTGVILTVQPTINSSRRVELTLNQEVSAAQPNSTSDISSPSILTRTIQTTLSLDDGETVMLGGLITQNYNDNDSGIPFLKDIPGLGYLFNNKSRSLDRTELIVLLTPYIIDSPETARQVRDAFRDQLQDEWLSGKTKQGTSAATKAVSQ